MASEYREYTSPISTQVNPRIVASSGSDDNENVEPLVVSLQSITALAGPSVTLYFPAVGLWANALSTNVSAPTSVWTCTHTGTRRCYLTLTFTIQSLAIQNFTFAIEPEVNDAQVPTIPATEMASRASAAGHRESFTTGWILDLSGGDTFRIRFLNGTTNSLFLLPGAKVNLFPID